MRDKKNKNLILYVAAAVVGLYLLSQGGTTFIRQEGISTFMGALINMDYTRVDADAMASYEQRSTPFGTSEDYIGVNAESGYERESYIRWDISQIPDDVVINNATMELSVMESDTGNTVAVYHLYDSWVWDEATVTWDTPGPDAGTDYDSPAAVSISIPAGTGRFEFNVKTIIQACKDNQQSTCSMLLKATNPSMAGVLFRAREQGVNGPSLSVDWSGTCVPDWACEPWDSVCDQGGQTRNCVDNNACGTDTGKPAEWRECCEGLNPAVTCGQDLYGNECGTCTSGYTCSAGTCVESTTCSPASPLGDKNSDCSVEKLELLEVAGNWIADSS